MYNLPKNVRVRLCEFVRISHLIAVRSGWSCTLNLMYSGSYFFSWEPLNRGPNSLPSSLPTAAYRIHVELWRRRRKKPFSFFPAQCSIQPVILRNRQHDLTQSSGCVCSDLICDSEPGTCISWTLLGHDVLETWKSRHLLRKSVLLPVCQSHKPVDLATEVWSSCCLLLLRSSTWVTYGKLAPTLGRSARVKVIVQNQAAKKGKGRPFSRTYSFYEPIIKVFAAFPKQLSTPLWDSILVNTFPNDLWGCCRNLLCVSTLSRHLKTLVIIMTSTTSNGNVQEIILLTSLWERALTVAQMIAMTSWHCDTPDSRGQTQLETTFIIISSPASHICSHTEVHKMS